MNSDVISVPVLEQDKMDDGGLHHPDGERLHPGGHASGLRVQPAGLVWTPPTHRLSGCGCEGAIQPSPYLDIITIITHLPVPLSMNPSVLLSIIHPPIMFEPTRCYSIAF